MKPFRLPLCRLSLLSLILSTLNSFAQSCAPLPDGIISWWKAEGTAADVRGLNFGYPQGGASFAAGKSGQAFNFDGVNQYVNVPSSPSLHGMAQLTLECWFKANSLPASGGLQVIAAKGTLSGDNTSCYGLWIANNAGTIELQAAVDTTSGLISLNAPFTDTNSFHHVAVTYDGAIAMLYVDGTMIEMESISGAIQARSEPLTIGRRSGGSANSFHGLVDELTIYNEAISNDEVAEIYSAHSNAKCALNEPGISIAWTNSTSGSWTVPSNWSPNKVPTLGDDVQFAGSGTYTVTVDTSLKVNSLSITAAGARLTVPAGVVFETAGNLSLSANGIVTVSGSLISGGLQLTSGTLNGPGVVSLTGPSVWSTGDIAAAAKIAVLPSGTLTINGVNDHDLPGCSITNFGTIIRNAGRIRGGSGTVIHNDGLWLEQSNYDFNNEYSGAATRFVNSGTFRKTVAGTSRILGAVNFINSGVVEAATGIISFQGGGSNTGTFSAATGAKCVFDAPYTLGAGSTFTGAGTVELSANPVTFTGAIHSENLTWANGVIAGTLIISTNSNFYIATAGDHDWPGVVVTNRGTIVHTAGRVRHGSGSLVVNEGLWLEQTGYDLNNDYTGTASTFLNVGEFRKTAGGNTRFLGNVRLNNPGLMNVQAGTVVVAGGGSGNGRFNADSGGICHFDAPYSINNGASFTGTGTNQLAANPITFGGSITSENLMWLNGVIAGTLVIPTNNTFYIITTADHDWPGVVVTNRGTIVHSAGRVRHGSGSLVVNEGLWSEQTGYDINNDYGGNASTFLNVGEFRKTGGGNTRFLGNVRLNNPGLMNVQAGTVIVAGGGASAGRFNAAGGTACIFDASYSINNGATFTGAGINQLSASTITFNGSINSENLTWLNGTIAGKLVIPTNNTFYITTVSDHEWPGAVVTNRGTIVHTAGRVRHGSSSLVVNEGLWLEQTGYDINNDYGGNASTFLNAGEFRKTAGGNTRFLGNVRLNNPGLMNVQAGTVTVAGGGSSNGRFETATGTVCLFDAAYTFNNGASFTGGGASQLSADPITFSGSISSENLQWVAGRIAGSLTVSNDSTFYIAGVADHEFYSATINNNGTIIHTAGRLRGGSSSTINNSGSWIEQSNYEFNNDWGGTTSGFLNYGTFHKSVGTGTTFFRGGFNFVNQGLIDVQNGMISFQAGYTHGTTNILAHLRFGLSSATVGGRIAASGSAVLRGSLSANLQNGYVPAPGDTMTLATFASRTGVFSDYLLPPLPSGNSWEIIYNPTSVGLRVGTVTNASLLIAGAITDHLGNGVSGLNVYAQNTAASPPLVLQATTGAGGAYSLNVPDASWSVGVSGLSARGFDPVTNQFVTLNGSNAVVNFVLQPYSGESFIITPHVNPLDAGILTGGGSYPAGALATITATATTNAPWIFSNWTENGFPQSANAVYTFPATRSRILVANFRLPSYAVAATVTPTGGGTVSGTGSKTWGTTATLTANPNFGYKFGTWTENVGGDMVVVGTQPTFSFVVSGPRTLVANFEDAHLIHDVTTATLPGGLATVTGAGSYTNGASETFTAPLSVVSEPNTYTFKRFLMNGAVYGTNASFLKTFSTTDPTNMHFVAEYDAKSIRPLVIATTRNLNNPLTPTTNFVVTVRFDRAMQSSVEPVLSLTNTASQLALNIPSNGVWLTTVFSNDTYRTPPITLGGEFEGANLLFASLARDVEDNELVQTNVMTVVVDATAPAISAVTATPGVISAIVTWTTDEPATSRINYGGTTDYTATNSVGGSRTQHSLTLTGLSPATTYHFQVVSSDVAGSQSLSSDATFTTLAAPDLAVSDVVAPATAQVSQPTPVTFVISNIGPGMVSGPWQNAMLLSTNADGSSAQSLGHINFNPGELGLAPGASITVTQMVILPPATSGDRYLGVRVDGASQVYELAEDNNTAFAASPLTIVATDLVLTRVTVPDEAVFGTPIPIEFVVVNEGTATAAFAWNDRIHLSTTSNSFATVVATPPAAKVPLAPGESYTNTAIITLPLSSTSTGGEYYIVVAADHGNAIPEADENNNVLAAVLNLSMPPLPDLLVQDLVAADVVLPGVDFDLVWSVTNGGTVTAAAPWRETVSFSSDGSLNGTVIGAFEITNGLAPGTGILRTNRVRVPQTVSGDVRWIVQIDAEAQVVESIEANNAALSALASSVPVKLTVTPPLSQVSESRIPPTFNVRVGRSGPVGEALVVNVASSDPAALTVPAELTIPAGAGSAEFPATVVRDSAVTGSRLVTLTAGNPAIGEGVATMTVLDADRARVLVAFTNATMMQPGTVIGTITREPVTTNVLVVNLSSSSSDLSVPPSVTIPPNTASVTFEALALETDRVAAPLSVRVNVGAGGHDGGSAEILLLNDNDPQLAISVQPSTVSEGAGGLAALGTVTRGRVSARPQLVQLRVSDSTKLVLAPTVTIPGGVASASFHVGAIDNKIADGDRDVMVSAFVGDGFTGAPISSVASTTVRVTDVSGPSLRVFLSGSMAPKGRNPATTGIVRHNVSPPTDPVVVTLTSSDPTKATVPVSVTIPAGTNAASFSVVTLDDGVPTGNQSVFFTASALDFAPDTVSFTISDIHLADLAVTEVIAPANGLTKEIASVNYRIVNQGVDTARGGFTTRLFLSNKPALDGQATMLQEVGFPGDIPPGQGINQAISFFLPSETGSYWVFVVTDSGSRISEVLEDNNTGISSQAIRVAPSYTATVQTSVTVATSGTAVPLTGRAVKADNSPAPFEPVSIHIRVRGLVRTISAITDLDGTFSANFKPLAGEAGGYEIGATHPGVKTFEVQDTFSLLGMRFEPAFLNQTFFPGRVITNDVVLRNLSDRELTGLIVTVGAVNGLTVQTEAPSTIAADGTASFRVISTSTEPRNAAGRFMVHVASSEGAAIDLVVNYAVTLPEPRLEATPRSLNLGMVRGEQTLVELDVVNVGGAASGEMSVTLPNAPWIRAVTPSPMSSLAPGEKTRVALQLTPTSALPLGEYDGSILIGNQEAWATVPFVFRHVSDARGDLTVHAVDEVTYFGTNGTKVAGASIILRDVYTGEALYRAVTGTNGVLQLPDVREGKYHLEVAAAKHDSFLKTIAIKPGINNEITAFLRTQLVRYSWKVEEVDIEERVNIKLETTFETFVPAPVITIDPGVIDLSQVTDSSVQVELTVTNHGLIAAQDVVLQFQDGATWSVHPLTDDIGVIPARSSITLPVVFQKISGRGVAARGAGGGLEDCRRPSMGLEWRLECGPFDVAYWAPVMVIDMGLCPPLPRTGKEGPDPLGWLDIFPQPGPGGGFGTGRGFPPDIGWGTRNFVTYEGEPDDCSCEEEGFEGKCRETGELGFKVELGDYAEKVLNIALAPLQFARVLGVEFKFHGNGKLCTCCEQVEEESVRGLQAEGEVGIDIEAKIFLGLSVAFTDDVAIPGLAEGELEYFVGLGAEVTAYGSGKVSGKTKCLLTDPEISISGTVGLKAPIGAKCSAKVTGKNSAGKEVGGGGEAFVGAEVGFSGGFNVEITSEGTKSELFACRDAIMLKAEGEVSIKGLSGEGDLYWKVGGSHEFMKANCETNILSGGGARAAALTEGELVAKLLGRSVSAGSGKALSEELLGQFDKTSSTNVTFASTATPAPTTQVAAAQKGTASSATGTDGGVCAQVRLQIDQQAVVTRKAIGATLEISNETDALLENIGMAIEVYDGDGNLANDKFIILEPELAQLVYSSSSASNQIVLGGRPMQLGALATGSAKWLILPRDDAAPEEPQRYFVGGFLTYTANGVPATVEVVPGPVNVYPNAKLALKYFHQRDVFSDDPFTAEIEPSIPFVLGVMVQNKGAGFARNMSITSSQPKIVDNVKGLLIDFSIITSEVAGQPMTPSLSVNFGDIDPGEIIIGRWLLKSSLQGLFIDYKATLEHEDRFGEAGASVFEGVEIHELIRQVNAVVAFNDVQPDFLVNDVKDDQDLPDTLYVSNGSTNSVNVVQSASVSPNPGPSQLEVQLTAEMPSGWTYLRVPEPANGQLRLHQVRRSDGSVLPIENAWTTDRTFIGMGLPPRREHRLHLLDHDSTGIYTLVYSTIPVPDTTAPFSSIASLPVNSRINIPLSWSGDDNEGGTGIAGFDIYVSENSGPFQRWLTRTSARSGIYTGTSGNTYAFYSVAADAAGNVQIAPASPNTQTVVTLTNRPPVLASVDTSELTEGDVLELQLAATDPDNDGLTFALLPGAPSGMLLNESSGQLQWATAKGHGPNTYSISVRATDDGTPQLSTIQTFTVNVLQQNVEPTLAPIENQTVGEAEFLTFTAVATDENVPAQSLTFSLLPGAPARASIDPATGQFRWTPNQIQGGESYFVTIKATDNGEPALSATRTFEITVSDTLADFTVTTGSTNVLGGENSSLLFFLDSPGPLTNVNFVMKTDTNRLSNFLLEALPPGASATLSSGASNDFHLSFNGTIAQPLQGRRSLGRLDFSSTAQSNSALVPVRISDLLAWTASGELIVNGFTDNGRVIVINKEPVLIAMRQGERMMVICAPPGSCVTLESKSHLLQPNWDVVGNYQVEGPTLTVPLPSNNALFFYRAKICAP